MFHRETGDAKTCARNPMNTPICEVFNELCSRGCCKDLRKHGVVGVPPITFLRRNPLTTRSVPHCHYILCVIERKFNPMGDVSS